MDAVIAGVPVAALVIAGVAMTTGFGLSRRYAPLVAIAWGVGLMLLVQLAAAFPGVGDWIEALVVGVAIGLGAVGGHAAITKSLPALFREVSNG